MNSDETPRLPHSAPPRSAPSKSRWNRGPRPGLPAGQPAPGPVCGEVSDIATARESLSGSLAHAPAAAAAPAPVEKQRIHRTPAERELPQAKAEIRPPETSRNHNPAPPPAEPSPPPRHASAHESQGRREHYIPLLPDPANDPMPRRLRTEPMTLPSVQEYSPSAGRTPHKSIPAKSHRHTGHRENGTHRPKAHASIPMGRAAKTDKETAEIDDTAEVDAPKREGILSKLKRFFGLDKMGHGPALKSTSHRPAMETKSHASSRGEPTHEVPDGHRRRRRRGGRGRSDHSRGPGQT